tara:strand:+ start:2472 stop:3134 length:663 start_codon:yes stop_codon:yes gene_type:complete
MAYYLGRDVKVWIITEDADDSISVTSNACKIESDDQTHNFANTRTAAGLADSLAKTDITGVDIGIGVVDEDVSYMGQRSVLKAEIKKETTVSLTFKKSDNELDVIFNGPITADECSDGNAFRTQVGARWGCDNNLISAGLSSPEDHQGAGGAISYGYRVVVQLQDAVEAIGIPNACITGHSVSLSPDGVTEETLEFTSHVTPIIATNATDAAMYAVTTAI